MICKAFLFFSFLRYSVEWKQILEKHSLLPISPACRTNQSSLLAQGLSISDERCSAPPTKATSKPKTCTQNISGFVIYFKSSILKTCLQKDQLQNFLGRHHYLSDMNNWTGVITLNSLFCHNCFANNIQKHSTKNINYSSSKFTRMQYSVKRGRQSLWQGKFSEFRNSENTFKLGRETIQSGKVTDYEWKLKESNKPMTKILSTLPATTNSRKVSGDEFNTFTYNDTENDTQTD